MGPTLLNASAPSMRSASIRTSHSATFNSSVNVQPSSVSRRSGLPARLPASRTDAVKPLATAVGHLCGPVADAPEQSPRLVGAPEAPSSSLQDVSSSAPSSPLASAAVSTEPVVADADIILASSSSSPTASSAPKNNIVPLPWAAASTSSATEAAPLRQSQVATTPDPAAASTAVSSSAPADASNAVAVATSYTSETPSVAHSVAFSVVSNLCPRDHNSVTVKANTNVKDAAGAICKVLGRMPSALITALRLETSHDSLNRAIKSIAVARKYINDEGTGHELTFLPLNRSNAEGVQDPNLFAFICFKTQMAKGLKLLDQDQTDLNVSRGSSASTMANAIIHIIMDRGQAVMKAGGSNAIFIAMSALVNARRRLKRTHKMDIMTVPSWMTEDTVGTLGRESKFLRFNIVPCPINGPL